MKNEYYTYINTSDKPKHLTIEYEIDGRREVLNTTLQPKNVEADLVSKVRIMSGRGKSANIKITSIKSTETVVDSAGRMQAKTTSIGPHAPLTKDEILKKSVLMDIETTGLKGGDIIHQVAVYDPTEKKGYLYRPTPELLVQDKAGAGSAGEEALSRRLGRRLHGKGYDVGTHKEGKLASTLIEMIKGQEDVSGLGKAVVDVAKDFDSKKITVHQMAERLLPEVKKADKSLISGIEDYLIKTDTWQALLLADEEALKKAKLGTDESGELTAETRQKRKIFERISSGNATESELLDLVREASKKNPQEVSKMFSGGLHFETTKSMQELMTNDLAQVIKGKVTWIANAGFEAKEFGAQIDRLADISLDALNTHRAASNSSMGPVDRDEFFKGFQYGRYEKELEEINILRNKAGKKNLLTKNPFFGVLEGVSATSGDPFYSTDLQYNIAKAKALKSGDYSEMYEAMLKHTKAGDVRDILDMVKAQQSQLINEGIIDAKGPTSLSMEVQGRLYGFTEQLRLAEEAGKKISLNDAMEAMKEAESHMALGDTSITETRALKESLDQLEAMRIVKQGGAEAEELLRKAARGEGAYFRSMVYGSLANSYNQPALLKGGEVSPGLDEIQFRQRIGKSMVEIAEREALTVREPKTGFRVVEQAKKSGDLTVVKKIPVAPKSRQVLVKNLDDVFKHLEGLDTYKHVDKEKVLAEARSTYKDFFKDGELIESKRSELRKIAMKEAESAPKVIETFTKRIDSGHFNDQFLNNIKRFIGSTTVERTQIKPTAQQLKSPTSTRSIIPEKKPPILDTVKPAPTPPPKPVAPAPAKSAAESVERMVEKREAPSRLTKGIRSIAKSHLGKYGIIAGALGVLSTRTSHEETGGELLAPSYEDFLDAQAQFYGSKESYISSMKAKYGRMEGMDESGLSAIMRKALTDFGSPYQGPTYTQGVLEDHNLRRERHKYIQQQFGVRHFSEQGDIGFFFKRFLSTAFRRDAGISKESKKIIFSGAKPIDQERYGTGVRGKNLVEYEFSKQQFEFDVEDADTISIRRKGNINSPLSSFMGTGKQDAMSIRLAGIDSPEIAHQDRRAQPFAEKAKAIAADLISRAKDIRLVTRQDDTTYGRQVGMIYVDGKNLNLELVKRGAAAYLPYKSKGKPPIYNQKAFEDAQEYAQESKRGMWSTGYFQAYKEIVKATGETTTFNALANIKKVSTNANLMSVYSLMNQAKQAGGLTDQIMADIASTSERFKSAQRKNERSIFRADSKYSSAHELDLQAFGYNTNSINSSLDEIKRDLAGMIRTRGSKNNDYKLNTRSLRENNYHMVKDTLAARKVHEEAKIKQQRFNQMAEMKKYQRQIMMESLQHAANKNMFNSPIQHHRM